MTPRISLLAAVSVLLVGLPGFASAWDFYSQSGYQRVGALNGYSSAFGVSREIRENTSLFAEFHQASLSRTTTTVQPAGIVAISSRTRVFDPVVGVRRVLQSGNRQLYVLGGIGMHHGKLPITVVPTGNFLTIANPSYTGVTATAGAGILFGVRRSGLIKVGPEVRYVRYFHGLQANNVRAEFVIRFFN